MKKIIKTISAILLIQIVLILLPASAGAYEYFDIINYDVNITVHENNTIDVIEVITVDFSEQRHGIYRDITKKGTLSRTIDGQEVSNNYNYKMSKIYVENHNYESSSEGTFQRIKIGDADVYVDGRQVYNIYYSMDIGEDGYDSFDEFYFNLIGAQWDTTIHQADITVHMPKSFDKEQIGLSVGYEGAVGYDDLSVSTLENTIYVSTNTPLSPYQGITMRIPLDEGYFVGERQPFDWDRVYDIYYALVALLVFWFVVTFLRHGRDEPLYPSVQFGPPEGLTPAEIGYIVDGYVDNKDVVSLLIYWADKGYIQLIEDGRSNFAIVKLKELPQDAQFYETTMFSALFAKSYDLNNVKNPNFDMQDLMQRVQDDNPGDRAVEIESTSTKKLKDTFYTTVSSVKSKIKLKYIRDEENRLYTKKSRKMKGWGFVLLPAPIFAGYILSSLQSQTYPDGTVVFGIMMAIALIMVFSFINLAVNRWESTKSSKRIPKMLGILLVLTIASAIYLSIIGATLTGLVAVGSSMLIGLLTLFMHKRTPKSAKQLELILGLKEFIQTAEKDRIEILVAENPEYFYNVLPYAYVLGVSDKWSKQFEVIATIPPTWYTGRSMTPFYNTSSFMSSFDKGIGSMQRSMTSQPASSSSGGGGFSGGGSSGGGGGGGGGGSW